MVSARLYGQLGNQLFQYAAVLSTSLKYDIPYCIPKHTLNDKVWKPYSFENINYCDIELIGSKIWKEPSHAYHEIPKPEGNLIFDGYMQSYEYFQDYLPEIRKSFGFDDLPTNYDTVSIHVRRSDYLKYPTKHPVVTLEYLKKAVNLIEGDCYFEIFSDDLEWCKQNLNKEFFDDREFDYVPVGDAILDMKYMAMAEHNIIANSTYSWWAAYLNNNPDKIVVTPDESNWFGRDNKHLDVSDLLPKEWVRIKY